MMKRVLVPLDKTEAAEDVLALVAMLAKADATIRLVHVARMPETVLTLEGRTIAYADQEIARLEAEWTDYIQTLKARFGIDVEDALRFGDPASEIAAEAEAWGADAILLRTSTGCSFKRALLGSISEIMLRRAPIDVLMYRPASAR
jgi:nucleotide-binding universal stress UspA family protein